MAKEMLIERAEIRYVSPLQEEAGAEPAEGKWTADVWKLDEMNLNGRIYPTALAERIVGMGITTMAYDGHDADYASGNEYKCMVATCSNARIENGVMKVDIDFYDKEYEARLRYLVQKGVPIGVSSVGFGETADNGMVLPESYEIVRFLDFVTTPAGEVYANIEKEQAEKVPSEVELSTEALAEKKKRVSQLVDKLF